MPRPSWHRIFSAVCGLWLLTVLAEPAALHACPMHGLHGGAHSHAAAARPADHAHGAHPSHEHERAVQCTCVGACCAAVAVTVTDATSLLTVVVVEPKARVLVSPASAYRPAAIEYARPPTIGPPHHTA